ncbi:MAG: hypothetical protein H7210_05545 [Pyrinomonadaceae bacterium]|nr:hypothetical protein [Phycisphaerales bacterium]
MPGPTPVFDFRPPVRLNYFPGRLMTAADFAREQEYLRDARRRLTLASLGPGVVSGLKITPGKKGGIVVSSGFAIDRLGREVLVPAPVEVASHDKKWRYVVLEYSEELIEPLPTAVDGSGFGAVRETYHLTLRPAKPAPDDTSGAIVLGSRPLGRRKPPPGR